MHCTLYSMQCTLYDDGDDDDDDDDTTMKLYNVYCISYSVRYTYALYNFIFCIIIVVVIAIQRHTFTHIYNRDFYKYGYL